MRVCGMVKNVGEPGGGPFLAYNSDGTISLQILESSQIDMNNPEAKEMFEKVRTSTRSIWFAPYVIIRVINLIWRNMWIKLPASSLISRRVVRI